MEHIIQLTELLSNIESIKTIDGCTQGLYNMYFKDTNFEYVITNYRFSIECFPEQNVFRVSLQPVGGSVPIEISSGQPDFNISLNYLNTDSIKYDFNAHKICDPDADIAAPKYPDSRLMQGGFFQLVINHNIYLKNLSKLEKDELKYIHNPDTVKKYDTYVEFINRIEIDKKPENKIKYDAEYQTSDEIAQNLYLDAISDSEPCSTRESKSLNSKIIFPIDEETFLNVKRHLTSGTLANSNLTSIDCYINGLRDKETKNVIRIKYGIFRFIIDFCHDFLNIAIHRRGMISDTIFEKYGAILPSIGNEINYIFDKVQTAGGNVSQTACKNLWSIYAINYRQELGISFFPVSDFGNLGSSEIYKDYKTRKEFTDEFIEICTKLKSMGITHFYIESQNAPLATALIKNDLQLIHSNIALRDAAPGYSFKTAVKDGLDPTTADAIWVNRDYNPENMSGCPLVERLEQIPLTIYKKKFLITNGPDSLISKYFGFGDITAIGKETRENTLINTINSKLLGTEILVDTINASKPPQLGLNAIIETANTVIIMGPKLPQLRGEGNAQAIEGINATGENLNAKILNMLSLKTYTDYCQADEMEQLKNAGVRLLFVSNDFLASRTASDFFTTPAVYLGINNITVTYSDTRYDTINKEQLYKKLNVYMTLCRHNDFFKKYTTHHIDYTIDYLKRIKSITLSPSIYYSCSNVILFLEQTKTNAIVIIDGLLSNYNNIINQSYSVNDKINFLKQFPEFISIYIYDLCKTNVLSQFFEEFNDNFLNIIISIFNIKNRTLRENFIEIIESVKKELINALPTTTPDDELELNLICLYAATSGTKKEHGKNSFLTNLKQVIQQTTVLKEKEMYVSMYILTQVVFYYNSHLIEYQSNVLQKIKPDKLIKRINTINDDNLNSAIIKPPDNALEKLINDKIKSLKDLKIKFKDKIESATDVDQLKLLNNEQEYLDNMANELENLMLHQVSTQLNIGVSNLNLVFNYGRILEIAKDLVLPNAIEIAKSLNVVESIDDRSTNALIENIINKIIDDDNEANKMAVDSSGGKKIRNDINRKLKKKKTRKQIKKKKTRKQIKKRKTRKQIKKRKTKKQ